MVENNRIRRWQKQPSVKAKTTKREISRKIVPLGKIRILITGSSEKQKLQRIKKLKEKDKRRRIKKRIKKRKRIKFEVKESSKE